MILLGFSPRYSNDIERTLRRAGVKMCFLVRLRRVPPCVVRIGAEDGRSE